MTERQKFYRSDRWNAFRQVVINERMDKDGFVHCAECGKAILKRYDMILHHKQELTEDNVGDATISLNPDNIDIVCFKCHNMRHERFGFQKPGSVYTGGFKKAAHEVVIVYGSPGAGKTTWVRENARPGDLIVDLDEIWDMVKADGGDKYERPRQLKQVVFAIRDKLYDIVEHRLGEWDTAFVIGTLPQIGDRERLMQRIGADRLVHIDTDRVTCAKRITERHAGEKSREAWLDVLDNYWDSFQEDTPQGA